MLSLVGTSKCVKNTSVLSIKKSQEVRKFTQESLQTSVKQKTTTKKKKKEKKSKLTSTFVYNVNRVTFFSSVCKSDINRIFGVHVLEKPLTRLGVTIRTGWSFQYMNTSNSVNILYIKMLFCRI